MSSESRKPRAAAPAPTLLENLRRRADLLERTRRFFKERGVLEVETPLLARGMVVEVHVDPITCAYHPGGKRSAKTARELFLQPSPEGPMKRLLSSGSGAIYQITRAFRDGERGRLHSPEFTILEWYRPEYDHHELMEEVGQLMRELLGVSRWEKREYREAFEDILGIDPLSCPTPRFAAVCRREGIAVPPGLDEADRNGWLDLLMARAIEPRLGHDVPVFIHGHPPSQAALAKIGGADQPIAERFELYARGVELCNGFHELQDLREHRLRFEDANVRRVGLGKEELPVDQDFLAALEVGLPPCAGVAVGFDRVVMLACGADSLQQVTALPFDP